jgi:mRNA interferase MazF
MATAPGPKRGEVWAVAFDPAVGAEIRKLRPAVLGLDTDGGGPAVGDGARTG